MRTFSFAISLAHLILVTVLKVNATDKADPRRLKSRLEGQPMSSTESSCQSPVGALQTVLIGASGSAARRTPPEVSHYARSKTATISRSNVFASAVVLALTLSLLYAFD